MLVLGVVFSDPLQQHNGIQAVIWLAALLPASGL